MSYYVVKVYGLTCDAAGCTASEEHVPIVDSDYKLDDTRRALATRGWTHGDGKDFCPKHGGDDRNRHFVAP